MIRDILSWMCIMTMALVGLSLIVAPDASAHTVPPWKCKYLMWSRAENGERYAWRVRCESYARNHNQGHYWQNMAGGQASWYGPGFYGKRTACGKTHTTRSWYVAALKPHLASCGLPLVVCSAWDRCVHVTVQDRGVWRRDSRALDLSPRVRDALRCPDLCTLRYQTERW